MNPLVIFALLLIIMIGASLVTIFAFLRYRFAGDLSYLFIVLFVLLFGITTTITLSLIDYTSLDSSVSSAPAPSF